MILYVVDNRQKKVQYDALKVKKNQDGCQFINMLKEEKKNSLEF